MKKSYFIFVIIFIFIFNKSLFADFQQCINYFNDGKFKESFNECAPLALAGDTDAINHIAYLNLLGKGVERNINKGIDLYKIAAKKNNSKAQHNLGLLYFNGDIINQNLVKAAFWYTLASQEQKNLIEIVNKIKKQLSDYEINQLSEMLYDWEKFGGDKPQNIDIVNIPIPSSIHSSYKITGSGTGFFVSPYGEILTNYHVVDGCKAITIITNNKRFLATIKNYEFNETESLDLALLQIDFLNRYYSTFQKKPVKLGQEILVAGYPLFGFLGETLQTTTGIVSSLSTSGNNFKEIQFTAPIQPGNSGGPIFSSRGTVLGVVVSSLQNLEMVKIIGRDILPQNLNNGIKGKEVKRFLLKSSDNIKIITGNTEYNFEELAELASIVTKPIECWK